MYICKKILTMDLQPFFKLLNDDDKRLLRPILISLPCFYTLISLYFPDFNCMNIISGIITTLGVTIIMTGIFYFQIAFIDEYNRDTTSSMITCLLVFTTFIAILCGCLSNFSISTLYAIFTAIIASYIISGIRLFRRRKKSQKK
jgi:hypothetical protein